MVDDEPGEDVDPEAVLFSNPDVRLRHVGRVGGLFQNHKWHHEDRYMSSFLVHKYTARICQISMSATIFHR
jgi:hypothetical protein